MTCDCVGDYCRCSGVPRLKDGATANLSLMLKDGTKMTQPAMDTMPAPTMTLDEARALPRYAHMSPWMAQQYAARDLAQAKLIADGINPERPQAAYDDYSEKLSRAWQGTNDNAAPGTPAQAHDAMCADLENAWKSGGSSNDNAPRTARRTA